ncbi:hypothetical protein J19TS2_50930 [Cohnella xylanilytica]|nr:hypothetical protein J19TS2_50930 [Cohnella xylanilytica]
MFLSSEYEKIKMSDIAKQMGMSNGILFVYFRTKEALFLSLLCREYEKRLAHLTEMAKEMPIRNFVDFKCLVMNELTELVDRTPLYIRLESLRTAELVPIICDGNQLTPKDVMDILQAEASIITGCKLSATLPAEVIGIIEQHGLDGLKRDFKSEVLSTMNCYVDGYKSNIKAI